jgi:hypothetical protein
MGIIDLKIQFDDWEKDFEAAKEAWIKEDLAPALAVAGEHFVNHAKSLPSPPASMRGTPHQPNYIDLTTNLRNANSYEVSRKGNVIVADVGRRETADFFARERDPGAELELLAGNGMAYASYVESKGYDVNSSVQAKVEQEIKGKFK